jgi:mxaJ protein
LPSRFLSRSAPGHRARLFALATLAVVWLGPRAPYAADGSPALRVCADPNNLPFSNDKGEGLENRLAELVGRWTGRHVSYTWWAQRRGFFRNTLSAGLCDVVMGVPAGFERALTTAAYYRSSYAFVTRQDSEIDPRSFDDARIRTLRIGVQLVGDDGVNTPPAHALTRRGIVSNVHGYSLFADYSRPNPPARIIDAVSSGELDVALVWGPLAGYFAARAKPPLRVRAVESGSDDLPMSFSIALGVRKGDQALRDQLDKVLHDHQREVEQLLDQYGFLRVGGEHGPG